MQCIDQIPPSELKGKRVFLRTSLNVPVSEKGEVTDLFRLKRGLPTVEYLVSHGAKVIIAGYFGRKGESMQPVAQALIALAPHIPIRFLGSPFESAEKESALLKEGECLVLENLRRDPGEEANDPEFAKLLASMAELYVDDALAEAHRSYASNVGITSLLPSYSGILMRAEIDALEKARTPQSPSFAILGGAKFETKAPLIKSLLKRYDHLFITGALANDVFKAKGLPVGRSLISKELPGEDVLSHPHFLAPNDVTTETSDKQARVKKPEEVIEDDKIVDIGPASVEMLVPYIEQAQFILWNGPTGLYEGGYTSYSTAIAHLIAKRVAAGVPVVIGGGDTIASLENSGISQEDLGFLSTGGGAMLEYLLQGTLHALDALR